MIDGKITVRFMSKVDKNGPTVTHVKGLGCCWLWTAALDKDGYGKLRVGDRKLLAHRASWAIHNGPIPEGMCVLHRCDVKLCVNPAHLFLGTQADNMRDMTIKGRGVQHPAPPGEGHHFAKLTDAKVVEIRTLYAMGGVSQRALAKRFGVAYSSISDVLSRKHWAHV